MPIAFSGGAKGNFGASCHRRCGGRHWHGACLRAQPCIPPSRCLRHPPGSTTSLSAPASRVAFAPNGWRPPETPSSWSTDARTSAAVFTFLSRFTSWRPYEHRVLASVDGDLLPIPINLDTINSYYGLSLTEEDVEPFLVSIAEPVAKVRTSEEVVVSRVGRELYEKFFRGYTRKQWGLDPSELDASVAARIPVRTNRDDRYFTDRFQAMPADGYTALFTRMLDHPRITVLLGVDWRALDGRAAYGEIVYTGPVDEFFEHRYDPLPYRSLDFEFETLESKRVQPVGTVNYPNDRSYTRQTEFKHLTGQIHPATTVVREYPRADGDPYYPIPRPETKAMYERYRVLADATPGVHFVGRLATYKYYNMDQVVAQALTVASRLVTEREGPRPSADARPRVFTALRASARPVPDEV
jgi:UDP-galactopyranose mutase